MKTEITPHIFANDYEFRGDGGDYTPTEGERVLIEDAICGYLAVIEAENRLAAALSSAEEMAVEVKQTQSQSPGICRSALFASLTAMKIASALPRVAREYDFSHAIRAVETALQNAHPSRSDVILLEWGNYLGSPIAKTAFGTHYKVEGSTTGNGKFAVLYSEDLARTDTFYSHRTIEAAKAAAQQDYETRIRSALVDVPAVESEPGELAAYWIAVADVMSDLDIVITRLGGGPRQKLADKARETAAALTRVHPPRSSLIQSEVGEKIAKLTEALRSAADWIGILKGSTGNVVMPSHDERDPRLVEERTNKLISEALSTPPSPYGGDNGDGSATGTSGDQP